MNNSISKKIHTIDTAIINKSIKSVIRCEAKIHKIVLGCKKLDYPKIIKAIGPIKIDSNFDKRYPHHRQKGIKQFKKGRYALSQSGPLLFFFDPSAPYYPWCMMEFSYPSNEFLMAIDKWFPYPQIQVSSAEYANDIFCERREEVITLYHIMKQYLYFPWKKDAVELVPESLTVGPQEILNDVWRYCKIRFYLRGPDRLKEDGHWLITDVDRVRLEYTANDDDLKHKYRIQKLTRFLRKGPFFEKMMDGKFKFKVLKGKKFTEDIPVFHQKYLHYKHIVKVNNISQYLREITEWDKLKKMMFEAMREYDKGWKRYNIWTKSIIK